MTMSEERELLKRARDLIRAQQYDRARVLLKRIPHNEAAQVYLQKLDKLDPKPTTFEEAKEDLKHAKQEIAQAEEELEEQENTIQRAVQVNYAVLVFLGTLLGSLIGAAADFGGAIDTFERFRSLTYPELCVVGSSTVLEEGQGMAQAWKEDFEQNNQVRISIQAIGSTAGIDVAAEGGCAHVLAMSEPMSTEQQRRLNDAGVELVCAAEIGYDIIVFVTDINNPVSIAPLNDISGMLLGRVDNWNRLSTAYDAPVRLLARQESGTTDVVLQQVSNFNSRGAREFPPLAEYEFCDSNEECLDRALSTNGSLYWVSTAWIRTQPPQYFQVIEIVDGDDIAVNPLEEAVDLDDYPGPLQRPLYMHVLRNNSMSEAQLQLAEEFLTYVRGVRGQQILEENFFYNHFDQPTAVSVPMPVGFDPITRPGRQICKPGNTTTTASP